MTERRALIFFIGGVMLAGLAIGSLSAPGDWYAGLAKPWFNPPNWVFAPAWTVLYVLIGIAGWRIWRLRDRGGALAAWIAQMALNFAWTPVFFVAQQIGAAFVVVLLLLAAILAFIALAWNRDRTAALLFLPYAAWVTFAATLNGAVWRLN